MKGATIASSVSTSTDDLYLQVVDLRRINNVLLAELDSLKLENEILKVIAGE